MRRVTRSALGGVLAAVLGWSATATAQSPGEGTYLQRPQGPYRGRVIDTVTDQPLPGAVVIIMWDQADNPVPGDTRTVAARESLTDTAGEFVFDVSAIEGSLPPRTLPPRLLVFKPGYTTFPRKPSYPPGAPAAPFTGGGSAVKLTPVSDPEDRIEYFNTFFAGADAANIVGDLGSPGLFPETHRLILEELKHFGVPVRGPGRPGGSR